MRIDDELDDDRSDFADDGGLGGITGFLQLLAPLTVWALLGPGVVAFCGLTCYKYLIKSPVNRTLIVPLLLAHV